MWKIILRVVSFFIVLVFLLPFIILQAFGSSIPFLVVMPYRTMLVIFFLMELFNIVMLCYKGWYSFFTCPVFCIDVLSSCAQQSLENAIAPTFLALFILLKCIEIIFTFFKRSKGQLCLNDYFTRNAEGTIVFSLLCDISYFI